MLPVIWLPEAYVEVTEALARYARIRLELGLRFAEAVVDTVEQIASGPMHYAVPKNGRRRAGVHRFPYGAVLHR